MASLESLKIARDITVAWLGSQQLATRDPGEYIGKVYQAIAKAVTEEEGR